MKRFLAFVCIVMAMALFTINLKYITPAHAGQETKLDVYQEKKLVKSVLFAIGVNKYFVDGKADGMTMDAKPFLQDGRTFVPIRFLSNALGVPDERISWEDATKTVTLTSWKHVRMTIGSKWIATRSADNYVGESYTIDVSPILKENEGRTYLPARYVAEALGYEVGWDEESQTVLCWPKGETKPDVSAVVQKAVEERGKLEGKPIPITAPPGYKVTSMGYVVPSPENTRMKIEDKRQDVNLTLMIYLPHTAEEASKIPPERVVTPKIVEAQLQQAEEILASKHGREIARAAVDYARQKTNREQQLERKKFPLPEGGKIAVSSQPNAWYIVIQVWRV